MQNLALILDGSGRSEKALDLFEQSVEAGHAVLPEDDHEFVTMRVNYGATLHEHGRLTDADAVLQEVAESTRRVFGDSATGVAHSHYWYGRNLLALGRTDEARAKLQLALDIYLRLNEHSARRYRVQTELADALRRQGHTGDAERLLREAADGLRGQSHEPIALERLVAFYRHQGRPAEAAPYRARLTELGR